MGMASAKTKIVYRNYAKPDIKRARHGACMKMRQRF